MLEAVPSLASPILYDKCYFEGMTPVLGRKRKERLVSSVNLKYSFRAMDCSAG